jgi:hypothetical protein
VVNGAWWSRTGGVAVQTGWILGWPTAAGTVSALIQMGDDESTGIVTTANDTTTITSPALSFDGFFQPVDNLPTVNSMNVGRAVPVKFSLAVTRD